MTESEFLRWLVEECGYLHPKPIPGGRYACIFPKLYTHAIITGRIGDRVSIGDCWCYEKYVQAVIALSAWDGTGEPEGWIRHPDSGRRVSQSPDEIDDDGRRVGAVGARYVRG
jgi:hypothetical protein